MTALSRLLRGSAAALCLLLALPAAAQRGTQDQIPSYLFADLPQNPGSLDLIVLVVDAITTGSCTAGGGSSYSLCAWNGIQYEPAGGSGGAAIGGGGVTGMSESGRRLAATLTISNLADTLVTSTGGIVMDGPDPQACASAIGAGNPIGIRFLYGGAFNCRPGPIFYTMELTFTHAEAAARQFDFALAVDDECDVSGYSVVTGARVQDVVIEPNVPFQLVMSAQIDLAGTAGDCIVLLANEDLAGAPFTISQKRAFVAAWEFVNPGFTECQADANSDWATITRAGLTTGCVSEVYVADMMQGGYLHNRGAVGAIEVELPGALVGDNFLASVVTAQQLCLDPNGTEDILGIAAGGNKICSSTVGSSVSCVATSGGGAGVDWLCSGAGFTDGGP